MNRRVFLKLAALSVCTWSVNGVEAVPLLSPDKRKIIHAQATSHPVAEDSNFGKSIYDDQIKDYLTKIRNPDAPHRDDIVLDSGDRKILSEVVAKLQRLYRTIGHGHFGVLGFDDGLYFARNQSAVGKFNKQELLFLEMVYHQNADIYGFYGEKQLVELTQVISQKEIYKVPYTGNYLFKGESLDKYNKIKHDLGDEVLLTSGIRGLMKQFYLFLRKADKHDGNLSLASRSLAPPGYSYHATGDFDIGQMGLGAHNFSEKFTTTPVFKKLAEQGYIKYRYQKDNMLGVRYEPWHIKLVV